MTPRLPSLQALWVFDAAARHKSFTRAAPELHVTPVAVSRMVGRLEDTLGCKLFDRTPSGLQLTADGDILRTAVAAGFAQISDAIASLHARRGDGNTVTLSISSGLTAQWLMPRYGLFRQAFPDINLRLQVCSILAGPLDGADLGIRLAAAHIDAGAPFFCPELIVPVCSARYLEQHGPLHQTRRGQAHTLIHLEPTTTTWPDYFVASGARPPLGEAITYSDAGLALQATIEDQGVALGWIMAVARPLNSGAVVPAAPLSLRTGKHYVIQRAEQAPRRQVLAVERWLVDEMAGELEALARKYPQLG
ncbi:MAG: LysR family transcriptional regulator [Burkholderiaceae bacterium]|nr:LysR family transcriptional regulator [Burkholderiaceae bacterium]